MTWGAMRLHRTLDSALSGGVTGSVLNTWKRSSLLVLISFQLGRIRLRRLFLLGGTRGTFTGLMFGSVFCTLGQVLYNEFGVQRIKFVSRRYPIPSQLPTPIDPDLSEPPASKRPLFDRMIHAIGLKRLSDEEYLAQMREKRAAYLRRIASLEAELEEEKNSKHP